jgi:hypothetical protein
VYIILYIPYIIIIIIIIISTLQPHKNIGPNTIYMIKDHMHVKQIDLIT